MTFATDTTVDTNASVAGPEQAKAATPAPTKEQRIAKLREQIAKLEQRIVDIENGVATKPTKKAVALPEVGSVIDFFYGRKTANTEPKVVTGTVLAVRPAGVNADNKPFPALVRVQFGEGFDLEVATIFPGSIVEKAEDDSAE